MIIDQTKEVSIMEILKLCESDHRFMTVIWDNEPLSSGELVNICARELGWKKSTTYTVLKKLCEKGFAKNEDTVVRSLIPRSEVQAYESERFILTAFLGGKTISAKEAAELKRLIDEHKED